MKKGVEPMPLPKPRPRGTEEQPGRRPLRGAAQGCFFSSRAMRLRWSFFGKQLLDATRVVQVVSLAAKAARVLSFLLFFGVESAMATSHPIVWLTACPSVNSPDSWDSSGQKTALYPIISRDTF